MVHFHSKLLVYQRVSPIHQDWCHVTIDAKGLLHPFVLDDGFGLLSGENFPSIIHNSCFFVFAVCLVVYMTYIYRLVKWTLFVFIDCHCDCVWGEPPMMGKSPWFHSTLIPLSSHSHSLLKLRVMLFALLFTLKPTIWVLPSTSWQWIRVVSGSMGFNCNVNWVVNPWMDEIVAQNGPQWERLGCPGSTSSWYRGHQSSSTQLQRSSGDIMSKMDPKWINMDQTISKRIKSISNPLV